MKRLKLGTLQAQQAVLSAGGSVLELRAITEAVDALDADVGVCKADVAALEGSVREVMEEAMSMELEAMDESEG